MQIHTTALRTLFAFLNLFALLLTMPQSLVAEATIGDPAPTFSLPGSDSKQHKLSQYLGKTVVLEWINFDCPFVKKHYHPTYQNMQKLQRDAVSKGIVWLSINSSAPGKQGHLTQESAPAALKENHFAATTLLFDQDGTVGRLYGAKTTPHLFIIDSAGILRYAGAIDDTRSTDEEDIPRSLNYITQALKQLENKQEVSQPATEPYGCSVKYAN